MHVMFRKNNVNNLIEVCENHLSDNDVQPGYPMWDGRTHFENGVQVTWCHRYADRVMVELGYNMSLLYCKIQGRHSIDWSTVQELYNNALGYANNNLYGVKKLTMKDAMIKASHGVGILVLSKEGYGHAGIVSPDISDGCMIYNAGSKQVMGCKSLNDTFIKWGQNPLFFQLPKS